MAINGETAVISGQLILNRLDFSIGANMPDEASLKFPVAISIDLTASRGGS